MPVVAFNVADVSTTYCQSHREKSCYWSMLSASCKTLVSDTALAVWIRCWAWPYIWIQMVDQRTFPSRILHFLRWSYQVQAEFHRLVKRWRRSPETLRQCDSVGADNVDHNICTLDGKNTWYGSKSSFYTIRKATTYFSEFTSPAQQNHESRNRHNEQGYSHKVVQRIARTTSIRWKV